ncbi:hypothetical protein, partial [Wolbachia endosymbiont of Pentidionis agamae]|uniref:hypothetical protein n=1 Tax=Wolbachia endosymbiont of Pentidionis agamae TaxID=3110435 RepID=UPI002FD5023C
LLAFFLDCLYALSVMGIGISNKNVIFYTGAVISSQAVPDMTELRKSFGLPEQINLLMLLSL